jgi:acyl-CoA thioesterase I
MTGRALRYVALGDSYTIGTSVKPAERWPDQLVAALSRRSKTAGRGRLSLALVANLAVNGFTSCDVLDRELPALDALDPEFVTLLVGVNDVVRGVPEGRYRLHLETILDDLAGRVGPDRVMVLTTPDYTVTPAGADYGDPGARARRIRRFNATLAAVAGQRGVALADIHDLSLCAAADRTLVADDGLHPSGAQYGMWVARIEPVVAALLDR